MKTPYGELNEGDRYIRADGSNQAVTVIDVTSYAGEEDAVVRNSLNEEYRIDWFKLMRVRYYREEKHDGTTTTRSAYKTAD